MKLYQKISLAICVLITCLSLAMGLTFLTVSGKVVSAIAEKGLRGQADSGARLVGQEVGSLLSAMHTIANLDFSSMEMNEAKRNHLLDEMKHLNLLDFGVVDKDGIARYIKGENSADLSDREYVRQALSGVSAVSDVIISRVTGRPVVMFAVPIIQKGNIAGALIARGDGNILSSLIQNAGFGDSGYAYILSSRGIMQAHPDESLVLEQYAPVKAAETDPALKGLADAVSSMLIENRGIDGYTFRGSTMVAGYSPVGLNGLIYVLTVKKSELMHELWILRLVIIFGTLAAIAVGLLLGMILGRTIARPIRKMLPVFEELATGNLTGRLSVTSRDELGQLAQKFNSSIEDLSRMIRLTGTQANQLHSDFGLLARDMSETAVSINQISSGIRGIKDQTGRQLTLIKENNEAVSNIRNTADELNNVIDTQASSVAESSAAVEEMVSNVASVASILKKNSQDIETLTREAEKGRGDMRVISEVVAEIEKDSEGLVAAVEIIQSISSQTNLLSMNAAIEAAHAGKAGYGFAVVAAEIRNLAETSAEQGKKISKVLKNLKKQIADVSVKEAGSREQFARIMQIMESVKNQETIITQAMDEQLVGNNQVLEAIREINEITSVVKEGSGHMLDASTSVLAGMDNLSYLSQEIGTAVDQIAAASGQVDTSISEVNSITRENEASVRNLAGEVSRFATISDEAPDT